MKNLNLINRISTANGKVNTSPAYSHVLFSIFMLFAMLLPSEVWGKMIYLDVSHNGWDTDKNATFQILGDGNSANWIHLEKVADHIYRAECSYTTIKFERRSANWEYYWNEGPQITVPADKNLYVMSDWAGNGSWSTYVSAGGDSPSADECTFKNGTTIYLDLNGCNWPTDGGKPAAMFYYVDNANKNYGNNSTSWSGEMTGSKQIGSGNYVLATQVSGDYWKVTVPADNLAYVRFVRIQASNAEWTWNCQKNKLALADMGSNNCVQLGGWDANATWTNYGSGSAVETVCPEVEPTLIASSFRGDMWLKSTADNAGWRDGNDPLTPHFVDNGDGTATLKFVFPNAQCRLTLYHDGGDQKSDCCEATTNITKSKFSSDKYYFAATGSTKLYTFTLNTSTGRFTAKAEDYPVQKTGWHVFVSAGDGDPTEVGTITEEGGLVIENLASGSHNMFITDGSANPIWGVNKFGGLYIDKTNSDVAWATQRVYYDAEKFSATEFPIRGSKDATGRFKLDAAGDVRIAFDGGKITINKVAAPEPAEELTGDWFIMGGHNGWSNNNPEHQMTISAGEATKTYYNVTSQFDFKVYGNGNEHGWSYYSQGKSDVTCTEVLATISNINLPTITAPTDVTIHYDGRNVWVTTDQHKTFGTNYALAGDFNSWNSTALPLTKINDYTATITQRFEPRKYSYCSADEGQTKRVKITNSDWKKQIKDVDIDVATSNFMTGTDCEDYDGRILIKVTQPTDVTFTIWKNSNDQMKVSIQAVPVQMHAVKFYDGDTEYTDKAQSVEAGQKPTAPAAPTKAGNIFLGWSETDGGDVVDVTTITINADKSFYAKWEAAEVQNIVFHSNYGSEVANLVVVKGEKATKPADPTKNGNTFLGWYENADFTGEAFDWANTTINKDYELYAKWSYSATYYLNGSDLGIDGWNSSDWDPNMPKAPLMEDAGDHIEYTVQKAFKMGDDIRFKLVPCNQKWNDNNACWNDAKGWSNFSAERSTQGVATYKDDATNIDIDITASGNYRVTMCYDGVKVYAIITEVATHTVTYQNGQLSTTREVADGEKASALSMAHRGVDVDWYDNEACTGATFDFNTPITASKTLYAKSKGASGNYFLTGAIWHNWTNENKTPEMTVENGVATYTFIAPVGQNTIRTLKGSRNEGDYIDARYFDAANSSTGIKVSDDNKQLYFTISDKPKQVTVTFDGAIRVQIEDYTPHYVDNLFLTTNGNWCKVWQANGTQVQTGSWDKRKEANKLRQNGTTGYVILRDVTEGEHLWKLIGNIDDNSRSGEQLFNAMYVDYTNSVSAAGNFEWNMTNCTPLNRQLSYENDAWRNVRFNVKKVCQLKIVFDGGLIRVMDLPQYTVTFNTNGGSAIDAKTVYEEERVAQPAAPSKPLYVFDKWVNAEDDSDFDFATPITKDITLKAVYKLASYSIHGPLWLVSTTNSDYRTDKTPAMINDGEKVTVSVIAPKGYQTFGILRDRSYADNCQIKPTCDNDASNVTVSRGDDMWFHFTLEDAAQITITYTNAGKVSVTVNYDYVKKDGWGVNNDLKSVWANTPMDENGELIMRDIQPDLTRGYNLNITAVEGESMAGINYFGAPYIAMNGENFWQYTCTSAWNTTIPQISNNKERAYYQDATMKFTAADLIQGKLDLRFTFDGKKITVTPLERVTITFDSKGGSAVGQVQAFVGNKAAKPADPTNTDDSSFLKWVKADKSEFDWNSTLDEDITLYAVWDRVQDLVDATAEGGELELTKDYAGGSVIIDKTITIAGNGHTIGNLIVTESGNLTISSSLIVNDFSLKANGAEHTSGQVLGAANLTVAGDAYFFYTVGEHVQYGWYDFTVPFPVDVMTGVAGIQNGELNTNFRNEVNYAIMNYLGDKFAAGEYPYKKFRGIMQPSQLYSITLDDDYNYNTIRFRKTAGSSIVAGNSITLADFGARQMNGVGNGALYHADVTGTSATFVQVYETVEKVFATKQLNEVSMVVGTAFMIEAAGAATLAEASHGTLLAPSRAATEENTWYAVSLSAQNTTYADQLFFTASEDGAGTYTIGADLTKAGNIGNVRVPQLWVNALNSRLAARTAILQGDQASESIALYAPEDGLYTIAATGAGVEGEELYLTQNGYPIWCLSSSEYSLYLPKGTTEEYGLLIHRAPKVATELTNGQSETTSARKLWYNGHVFILRDGQVFDVTGRMVK